MEKPRPSPNLGKLTATMRAPASSAASVAGSSVGSSTRSGGDEFGTMLAFLIRMAIDMLLEGLDAGALHHVDEALVLAVAQLQVGFDEALDHAGDVRAREGRPDDLA